MQIEKQELEELINAAVSRAVEALEKKKLIANQKTEKTAYQRTEQLLYSYNDFKRVLEERQQEIADLRKYGVPQRSGSIVQYTPHTGTVGQIVLPEESVEDAVHNVEASVQGTVQIIALIDKCMAALKDDPYYEILEMRYFQGKTQEDIAFRLRCSQVTVSKNKSRLVKELSLRLFPNQVINEYMN